MNDEITIRMASLEARLQRLEDERDISHLIGSYGPLVDGGAADAVADLWTDDGVYDVDEVLLQGKPAIAAMVRSRHHQTWIEGGCAHFLAPPAVHVDGDDAVAACHSLMVINTGGSFPGDGAFEVRRATAHHWALLRTATGWKVTRRTSRVLDGRAEARTLLVHAGLGERLPQTT
jgi:ketosteroid isomerase-like protein